MIVAAAVIVTAVVAWVLISALNYEGLENGSWTVHGTDGELVTRDEFTIVQKELRSGGVTESGVSVRNGGSHAVTITGVSVISRPDDAKVRDYQVTPAGTRMAAADGTSPDVEPVPFERFTLQPGHERFFMIRARLPACEHVGPMVDIDRYVVHYKALIFAHEQTLMMRTPIEFIADPSCR